MENLKTPPIPGRNKYPFTKMVPGDYKELTFINNKDLSRAQIVAHSTSKSTGYKFVTRKNGLTLQVWCIAKPDPFFGEI